MALQPFIYFGLFEVKWWQVPYLINKIKLKVCYTLHYQLCFQGLAFFASLYTFFATFTWIYNSFKFRNFLINMSGNTLL